MTRTQNKWSLVTVVVVVTAIVLNPFLTGWPNPFTWDTFGYYLYLPLALINADLSLADISFIHELRDRQFVSSTLYQINQMENGNWIIRYPSGLAVLLSPFYLIGHMAAKMFGFMPDGFSLPYQISIVMGSMFYASSGIALLRKLLLKWFTDPVVAITIAVLFFGTNLVTETTISSAMPHAQLFALYTFLIWLTDAWHNRPTILNSAGLGAVLGLAAICRPTDSIAVIIPILWGVQSWRGFTEKVEWVFKEKGLKFLTVGLAGATVVLIQLGYWKHVSGSFFVYSYAAPNEGLDIWSPYVKEVLFSFRKGWFVYTPLILLALVGIPLTKRYGPKALWALVVFVLINVWLVSSWTCWWYAESFGHRAMVQSYAVLAIGLAAFVTYISKRVARIKWVAFVAIGGLVVLNLFQVYQYRKGIIHGSRMTYEYYSEIFLKSNVDVESLRKLLVVDRDIAFQEAQNLYDYRGILLLEDSFENSVDTSRYTTSTVRSGTKALKISGQSQFSNAYDYSYDELTDKDHVWVEVSFWAKFPSAETDLKLVSLMERAEGIYKYRTQLINPSQGKEAGDWAPYSAHYLTPHVRSTADKFRTYFWQTKGGEVYIDDLTIKVYEIKD